MAELDATTIAEAAWAVLVTILGWLGATAVTRIGKLERTYVTREELQDALSSLRSDRHAMHDENSKKLDELEEKMDETKATVGKIATDVAVLASRSRLR